MYYNFALMFLHTLTPSFRNFERVTADKEPHFTQ